MENKEKELVEIKVKYDNGEEKIVKQGAVIGFDYTDDEVETTFHFVNISGQELNMVVTAVVELGMRLGMFNTKENEEWWYGK